MIRSQFGPLGNRKRGRLSSSDCKERRNKSKQTELPGLGVGKGVALFPRAYPFVLIALRAHDIELHLVSGDFSRVRYRTRPNFHRNGNLVATSLPSAISDSYSPAWTLPIRAVPGLIVRMVSIVPSLVGIEPCQRADSKPSPLRGPASIQFSLQSPIEYARWRSAVRHLLQIRWVPVPCTADRARAELISAKSTPVSSTSTALRFSSSRCSFVVPGIGTIHGRCANT